MFLLQGRSGQRCNSVYPPTILPKFLPRLSAELLAVSLDRPQRVTEKVFRDCLSLIFEAIERTILRGEEESRRSGALVGSRTRTLHPCALKLQSQHVKRDSKVRVMLSSPLKLVCMSA